MSNPHIESTTLKHSNDSASYKWFVLFIGGLTNAFVVAAPSITLSVLLPVISEDLHLTLVQAGWVWGVSSLPLIFMGLVGGSLGDKFGSKSLLIVGCILVGLTGALRGLSNDFLSLSAMSLLSGVVTPIITMNAWKTAGAWFSNSNLDLASGFLSMSMGSGFLFGSLLSATFFLPWLGGWRNVLFFYGAISAVLAIPWFFIRFQPKDSAIKAHHSEGHSIRKAISQVIHIRNIWLLGLAALTIMGANQGLMGYLPLYLTSIGWTDVASANALGIYNVVSTIFTIPVALLSNRIGSKKNALFVVAGSVIIGFGMLSFVYGNLIYLAASIAGLAINGFMAIVFAAAIGMKGIGPKLAGTSTGFIMTFVGIGNLLAPPIGSFFTGITVGTPFLFWMGLGILGFIFISQIVDLKPEQSV